MILSDLMMFLLILGQVLMQLNSLRTKQWPQCLAYHRDRWTLVMTAMHCILKEGRASALFQRQNTASPLHIQSPGTPISDPQNATAQHPLAEIYVP